MANKTRITKTQRQALAHIKLDGGCFRTQTEAGFFYATMKNRHLKSNVVDALVRKDLLKPVKESMLFQDLATSIQQYEVA